MKKRFFTLGAALMLAWSAWAEGVAKYVFYFIGDGMGVNQVNGTETYLAALEGRIGVKPLQFAQFPYTGLVTTYSATNGVTDSAAGGTALATGQKTKNGVLGMLKDQKTRISSIAERAKKSGRAVGVMTSVSVDHATPASFYAHVPDRNMYYEIGQDMLKAAFDFYGGSDFLQPTDKNNPQAPSLYVQSEQAGYTIARGYDDYEKKKNDAGKMILLQTEEASKKDRSHIPYALDRSGSDLTLRQITQAGIDFLTTQGEQGFFMMVEGGAIDWACHANDAAAMFHETEDLDQAVKVAYDFYRQHPDETLIVVTADHETGGLSLGIGPYEMHTQVLQNQKMSISNYSAEIRRLRETLKDQFTWDAVKQSLKENFGFWEQVQLSENQTQKLKKAYEHLQKGISENSKTLYQNDDELATVAKEILNKVACVGWQSGGHSNGYVPVFAVGVGAERFTGRMDNTDIPKKIAEIADYEEIK